MCAELETIKKHMKGKLTYDDIIDIFEVGARHLLHLMRSVGPERERKLIGTKRLEKKVEETYGEIKRGRFGR